MALGPWALLFGMVVVLAGIPLYAATLRPSLRMNLLYGHLGVLQLLRGFLATTYVIPLGGGVGITPNNIMYAGLMMTAILLVLVERRTAVLRTVILVLLGTEAIKLAVFATTRWALTSPDFVNVVGLDPEVYGDFLRISGTGSILIVVELLVMVAVLEQVRRRVSDSRALSLWAVGVFAVALLVDGALFSLVTEPLDPGLWTVVTGGVARKAVLAVAFGLPVLVFVLVRRSPRQTWLTTSLRLRDVLLASRHRLVERLEAQEQQRAELLERLLHTEEDERRRLADDLHDDAIQLLTAADIRLQQLAASSPELDLDTIQRLVRSGVGSLRRLILELRGPDVTAASFEPLARAYVERLAPDGGPEVTWDLDLPDDLPEDVAAGAFRIVLEALSNTVKHAEASTVTVRVAEEEELLVGEVADDGVGIPDRAETGPGHLGLRAMRDRAEVLGGVAAVRAVDGGTVVSFELPLERAAGPAVSGPPPAAPSAPGRRRRT